MTHHSRTSIHTHDASAEQAGLAQAIQRYFTYDTDTAADDAITVAKWLVSTYAPKLCEAVTSFTVNRYAALVIEGLPYDQAESVGLAYPEVAVAPKSSRFSEALLLGLSAICGKPYAVESEGKGLITNLCPVKSHAQSFTGLGSRRALGLHIENSLLRRMSPDCSPDGLALIGISDEPNGGPATYISDVRLAVERLSQEHQAILHQKGRYFLRLPQRWRRPGQPEGATAPIIAGSQGQENYAFAFYGDMVEPCDHQARCALNALQEALESQAEAVHIRPGRMVLINNLVAAHGRAAFAPSFSPAGLPYRWLQRVFWISDYRRLNHWESLGNSVYRPSGTYRYPPAYGIHPGMSAETQIN